ncbi:unnamed protein product [Eruca vesicaria subsp. sativa]|uniref:Uncharacterized protein n=1 Tax=Eruca vesicaria subsp. sativa TaxID=29727 RepID=A0ABC8LP34_ERUVS|nr:unnamed protein product [Eruca vesicaria subsp. sativa]
MTTRSDSDECLLTSEKASIFRDGFSQNSSLKVVSLPPLEKDSVLEMMVSSKKQVKSSPPLTCILAKYEETIGSSDSAEASFSKEPEAMVDVHCPGVLSVPETTTSSAFLEEDRIKETSSANISGVSTQVGEADGFVVVCISEKKGQEDSKVLEAEIEKKDVETLENNGNEQHQKMERVRVKDNAFVGRSVVSIDLVDDTALLNVVPFSKKAKDHPKRRPGTDKDAPRKHNKNGGGKQKIVGVGGKQQDKKGYASNVVEWNASTKLSETSGNQLRIVYSINQMKSMRYAHSANQKKLWSDVYARLLPELVAEYEGLVSLKTSKSDMRESGNGHVSAVPRRNRVNIFVH